MRRGRNSLATQRSGQDEEIRALSHGDGLSPGQRTLRVVMMPPCRTHASPLNIPIDKFFAPPVPRKPTVAPVERTRDGRTGFHGVSYATSGFVGSRVSFPSP
jgi:hypothetical protein